MTTQPLQPYLQKLARCRRAADVSGIGIDAIRSSFGSRIGAVLLLDDNLQLVEEDCTGCRLADVDEYHEHWRPFDRVFPEVVARAAPRHNWQVYTEDEWKKDTAWRAYGRRLDIYHYMSSPIFGSRGHLVGVMNFCRGRFDRPFDARALEMASCFSGFLSATLSRLSGAGDAIGDCAQEGLAPRELQVARLVACGRNNVQVALTLGIARETVKQTLRRVYRKLDVSGRAQMAATLAARGLLGD